MKNKELKSFFKDFSSLFGGTVIAQIIPILFQPVLKRLFTPEDFGSFDIFFKIVSLFAVLFSLRYEKAIVLSKTRGQASALFIGIVLLALSFFILFTVIFILFDGVLMKIINLPDNYYLLIYFIPLSAAAFTIHRAIQFYFLQRQDFFKSSQVKVVRRLSELPVQISFGIFGKYIGLVIGDIIGKLISVLFPIIRIVKVYKKYSRRNLFKLILLNFKKYKDFPKYSLLSNLLNTFVLSSLTFQVFAKFSILEVGYLELTQKILTIPAAMIGFSIGQIILQRFSSAYNQNKRILKKFIYFTFIETSIIIPFIIIIWFYGPELFSFIFGVDWFISGVYAKKIIISSSLFFIISPLGQVLVAINKIRLNSFWEYGKFLIVGSLFFVNFKSIESYLFAYNIIISISYISYFIIILLSVFKYQKEVVHYENSIQ